MCQGDAFAVQEVIGIKIAIIDRDTESLARFEKLLVECLKTVGLQHCQIIAASGGEDFVTQEYESGDYFLVFIDIQQNNELGMDGIEYARKIREKDMRVPIVFISSVNDYATETYQVDASYFALKPLDVADCYRMLSRVLYKRCSQNWLISLPDGFRCFLGEIIYIRQKNNECIMYMADQQHYMGGVTAEMLEKMLQVYRCLYRVDKETVINMGQIEAFERRALRLSNNHYITVSKRQLESIKKHQMNIQIQQSTWKN